MSNTSALNDQSLQNQSLFNDIAKSVPSPQKETKEIEVTRDRFETFLNKKNEVITNIVETNQTNIPNILDLQNLTAHFLLKAAKTLSSRCTKGSDAMESIEKKYETLLNKVEKIIHLKGIAVTIVTDITALIDALQAVSNDTVLSASEIGNQASAIALNTTAASNEESQTNPVSSSLSQEKNAEQFQSTLSSFHTTMGSVSNYIETIASHFNTIIQRAKNPTLGITANSSEHTYFNALFKKEAENFLAPDAFKNFTPATKKEIASANKKVSTTAKERLEFVYQIASDSFAEESSNDPLSGMIGVTKTSESLLTTFLSSTTSNLQSTTSDLTTEKNENNPLPLQHYFFFTKTQENENGQWVSDSGDSKGSNNDVNPLLKTTDYGEVSQLVIETYIAMRGSLQSNQSTRALGVQCMPLFIPPVTMSLANTEKLLRTAEDNAMKSLESAGQKIFTTEASSDTQNRKTINVAVRLITKALSEAATKLDNVAMQRDSLQQKTSRLESEKDQLNKTVHDLNMSVLNLSRSDTSMMEVSINPNHSINSVLNTSTIASTSSQLSSLCVKTPRALEKYIEKYMTPFAILDLGMSLTLLSNNDISPKTIQYELDTKINPLIAKIFAPIVKKQIQDKKLTTPFDIDIMAVHYAKSTDNKALKYCAAILLRLLCPQDKFDAILNKQPTEYKPGSFIETLMNEKITQGIRPRPAQPVIDHPQYMSMLTVLFNQTDAKAKSNGRENIIDDCMSDYLASIWNQNNEGSKSKKTSKVTFKTSEASQSLFSKSETSESSDLLQSSTHVPSNT